MTLTPRFDPEIFKVSPLQRISQPDEVAEAIHWLISSASMMTGAIVELDFGMHLTAI